MSTWDVKLQRLRAYGEDTQADGARFGADADSLVAELKSTASGMGVDPRFTEAAGLAAGAVKDAGKLGEFTGDMADGIQSYGRAAELSHLAYGGADVTAAEELSTVKQLLDDHTSR